MSKYFERRYHATWFVRRGRRSALSRLGSWVRDHPGALASAPRALLVEARDDVRSRFPGVAAREPTRRHRKHFAWLLGWHDLIAGVLRRSA